jgi:osmotically-inducible protein OsmY
MLLESSVAVIEPSTFAAPSSRSDVWLEHLRSQAAAYPLFQRRRITLSGRTGQVVLTGIVASFYEKQLAQEFARRFEGVKAIENHIEVIYRPVTKTPAAHG